jgi:hypothetical protein
MVEVAGVISGQPAVVAFTFTESCTKPDNERISNVVPSVTQGKIPESKLPVVLPLT